MKKLLVFLAVLFVSVMSSACINNFAIQELNTKAKEYLDKGDYDEAIKRLESSVDLDGSIFEARYNLAVAYTHKEEFSKAVNQLNEAIKLNPANPDAYYTLGVVLEGEAYKKLETVSDENLQGETESLNNADEKSDGIDEAKQAEENSKSAEFAANKLNEAIKAYEKYLKVSKDSKDADTITEHIKELQAEIAECRKYMVEEENNAESLESKS